MQDRKTLGDTQINDELLWFVSNTPLRFWVLFVLIGSLLGSGIVAVSIMFIFGLGVTGLNPIVAWGFMITNFVFWVGISHAGVMISAILRLCQAEWRRPVTRAAEVLTIFSMTTAAIMPLIHMGRPWRSYWVFPYDFARGVWPNVRSPLIWDPSAIFTYLSGTAMFVYVALLPDLAIARDRSVGWRRGFYAALSLGWRGTPRQWKLQTIAGILLSALILPVFVSVHSIVSWDFGVSLVPNWHATIFAPYFVIGAVHSGVSSVLTLMAALRWTLKLENFITPDLFDSLGRLLIAVATAWLYFFVLELLFGFYGEEPNELAVRQLQFTQFPFNMMMILTIILGYIIPVPLWLFRSVRRNIMWMFVISILVNIGMWMERFLIIVPGLMYRHSQTFAWGSYTPSLVEIFIVVGTFGVVGIGMLVFSKFFPIIPIADAKEGQILADEIQIGRVSVPAVIRE
ncbi:MAG: putative molybdopterin oxidoreductase, rane subunit [Dehalococcoidia bacterium]|nr:putative molybdopterin oxidoreductase, rane subunit [Dehalococcoidia bacterium]